MLQKKYVNIVYIVGFLVVLSVLFQPSAKAAAPSTYNKVQTAAIQKKITAIREKVKVKVDTTHVKKVEEKKIAAYKAAVAKKEQAAREAAARQAEQAKQQTAASNSQGSQSETEKSAEPKSSGDSSSNTQSGQSDVTTGASRNGREIGEKNREYGNQLSDPNLSDAERQRIIEEKKKYNQSHR